MKKEHTESKNKLLKDFRSMKADYSEALNNQREEIDMESHRNALEKEKSIKC